MTTGYKTGGRVPGTPNKATAEVRAIASRYGEDALKELARLAGLVVGADGQTPIGAAQSETARISALGMILDRGFGRSPTSVPIKIDLPDISGPGEAVNAMSAIVAAMACGDISPAQAKELADVIELQRRAIETQDLAERIARLEAQEGKR